MSQLSHPNTARVYKFGVLEDGAPYFVMDFLEGRNLAHTVRRNGPMDVARAIGIMTQVCGALDEAHRAGVIHRDLKPENIFLTRHGSGDDFPKVLDFGLAKVGEKQMGRGSMMLTQQGMVFGTPEFMSPEQSQGEELDARSDVYSLGLILYELLTGKLPFDAKKPIDVMKAHVKDPPIDLQERAPGLKFPASLWPTLERSLAKKPKQRFDSAQDFANALQGCLDESKTGSGAPAPQLRPETTQARTQIVDSDPPQIPISRLPMLVLGVGIGLGVAIVVAVAMGAI